MVDLDRMQLAGYAVAALLVVLLGLRFLGGGEKPVAPGAAGSGRAPARAAAGVQVRSAPPPRAVVNVVGEVRAPGVYRLRATDRVQDAVRRAGGATPRAALQAVNLAAKVVDGVQIVVPARIARGAPPAVAPAAAGGAATGTAGVPAAPLSLNTATLEQLDALDGIGPVTAQKILDYRLEKGGFASVDDLDAIPGIGPATMEALAGKVTG